MNYRKAAEEIVAAVGGKENISRVWHCMTRLRLIPCDARKINEEKVKAIYGVMGAQFMKEQYQVIIGNEVDAVCEEVEKILDGTGKYTAGGKKKFQMSDILDVIGDIFTPVIGTLAGTSVLKGFLSLAVLLGWMSIEGETYKIFYMISDCVLYFMPFFLAITTARKLKTSEFMAISIAAVLMYPTLLDVASTGISGTAEPMKLFGILPVQYINYSSSVIPIVLAVILLKYIYKWVRSWMPKVLTIILTPMVTLLIVVPVTLVVLGPLGSYIGNGLSAFLTWMLGTVGIFAGAILGGISPFIVMTGMHYSLIPSVLNNYATLGYDIFLMPVNMCTNIAQGGAALGVAVKSKNKELKAIAYSSGVTALIGITEPAMYGVNVKLKRPLYYTCIGGAVSGAYVIGMGVKTIGGGSPGLLMLPGFVFADAPMNIIHVVIGIALAFIIPFILTLLFGFREDNGMAAEAVSATKELYNEKKAGTDNTVYSPLNGEIAAVQELADPTFANEVMGTTAAIVPGDGSIKAPFNGEVIAIAGSGHALGLKSVDGTEVLIHIGIDTVELGGKGFELKVTQNQKVQTGQELVRADLDVIRKAGLDTTTMVIVTNSDDFRKTEVVYEAGAVIAGEELLKLKR